MENLNTDVNRSNLMALLNFCTIFTALILVIPHNNTSEECVFQLFAKMRRFQTIFCSGLKGRRPFWLLNPPSRGVPSLFLLVISLSGDEEVES